MLASPDWLASTAPSSVGPPGASQHGSKCILKSPWALAAAVTETGCMQGSLAGPINGVAWVEVEAVMLNMLRSPKWGSVVEITSKA